MDAKQMSLFQVPPHCLQPHGSDTPQPAQTSCTAGCDRALWQRQAQLDCLLPASNAASQSLLAPRASLAWPAEACTPAHKRQLQQEVLLQRKRQDSPQLGV